MLDCKFYCINNFFHILSVMNKKYLNLFEVAGSPSYVTWKEMEGVEF